MVIRAATVSLFVLACLIGGCGGGVRPEDCRPSPLAGQPGNPLPPCQVGVSPPTPQPTTFTSAAMAGELVTYVVDTATLTYRYTITDSMYGLTGTTRSGTLTRNANGTYTLSGITNGVLALLPNGLMLGAIREPINGTLATVPIIGMNSPVTSLTTGAGIYNFVQRTCLSGNCASAYGTFQINADGTWSSCPSGNAATGCTGSLNTGIVNSLGSGKWQVLHNGQNIGTAIIFASGSQNVVILDLVDTRPLGFGVGILVGASEQPLQFSNTDGTWFVANIRGEFTVFTASGGQVTSASGNVVSVFTPNVPWTGMGTTNTGGHGFLAGTGVYAYENSSGYAEVGVKIR